MTSDSTGRRHGLLTPGELDRLMAAGEVDTVIVAFADMQGRLTGKRVSARLFAEEVAAHGAECCNYLLAVDVEMNTVDGYAMSSWDSGYGDMVMRPDMSTLRLLPWRRRAGKMALGLTPTWWTIIIIWIGRALAGQGGCV